jgi:hypothetical protein
MKLLRGKDLKGKTLDEWLRKRRPSDFGDLKADYVKRYNELEDFLRTDVHPLVSIGAAVKDGIFLNDHGPAHVATVIKRASDLVSADTCELTPYETYVLLAAIQLHDIGNILGRTNHESRPRDLEGRLEGLLGDDSAEKRLVRGIAEAHGGTNNGDKDTIRQLVEDPVLNQKVRTRFLAGILRFADELADDSQRISTFAIENNAIPDGSRLFHKYSRSLQSVIIDLKGQAINLHYDLTRADAQEEFSKDNAKLYLIDEILNRTVKMHRERTYCIRFLRPSIQLECINIKINVFKSNNSPDTLFSIGYRLEDKGYPTMPEQGIYEICPELSTWRNGQPLNGSRLLAEITETKE